MIFSTTLKFLGFGATPEIPTQIPTQIPTRALHKIRTQVS